MFSLVVENKNTNTTELDLLPTLGCNKSYGKPHILPFASLWLDGTLMNSQYPQISAANPPLQYPALLHASFS